MFNQVSKNGKQYFGFTVIEVIIAVALLLSAAALSVPFMSSTLSRNELDVALQRAVDMLNEARSSAFNGLGGGEFGVRFESGAVVFFSGDTYSAVDPDNVDFILPGFVSITDISISGGGSEIVFESVSGAPTQTGSVEFTDSSGETKTVSVNTHGTVNLE